MKKGKHLELDDRYEIARGLSKGDSFKKIAAVIGKDCTTVSKEIRSHIKTVFTGGGRRNFNDCQNRTGCLRRSSVCHPCTKTGGTLCRSCGACIHQCPSYKKETCSFLPRPPYVCNGCGSRRSCSLEKKVYDPEQAHKDYVTLRRESRMGFNLTEDERNQLDAVISPLLKQGQSIHHIILNNQSKVNCCERTAYTYADHGLFEARNIDMPRKVRFRKRKQKSVPLKVDKACRNGRNYEDFLAFRKAHPELGVVELDSVEGKKGKAVLLTIHFVRETFQLAYRREANTSQSVTDIFNRLYEELGSEMYRKLFPLLLCDNGTEFSDPAALEYDQEGNRRSYVFYCNPSSPHEKPHCENNHEFIRKVIPKGVDITPYTQDQIRLMMSHINSYGRPELEDRTPYAVFRFYHGQAALNKLGITYVRPNDIILRPSLLKEQGSDG